MQKSIIFARLCYLYFVVSQALTVVHLPFLGQMKGALEVLAFRCSSSVCSGKWRCRLGNNAPGALMISHPLQKQWGLNNEKQLYIIDEKKHNSGSTLWQTLPKLFAPVAPELNASGIWFQESLREKVVCSHVAAKSLSANNVKTIMSMHEAWDREQNARNSMLGLWFMSREQQLQDMETLRVNKSCFFILGSKSMQLIHLNCIRFPHALQNCSLLGCEFSWPEISCQGFGTFFSWLSQTSNNFDKFFLVFFMCTGTCHIFFKLFWKTVHMVLYSTVWWSMPFITSAQDTRSRRLLLMNCLTVLPVERKCWESSKTKGKVGSTGKMYFFVCVNTMMSQDKERQTRNRQTQRGNKERKNPQTQLSFTEKLVVTHLCIRHDEECSPKEMWNNVETLLLQQRQGAAFAWLRITPIWREQRNPD